MVNPQLGTTSKKLFKAVVGTPFEWNIVTVTILAHLLTSGAGGRDPSFCYKLIIKEVQQF